MNDGDEEEDTSCDDDNASSVRELELTRFLINWGVWRFSCLGLIPLSGADMSMVCFDDGATDFLLCKRCQASYKAGRT